MLPESIRVGCSPRVYRAFRGTRLSRRAHQCLGYRHCRCDGPRSSAPVIWPLHPDATAAEIGGSGVVVMDGAVQRGGLHARTVLCPVNDRLVSLAVSSVEGQISGETVADSPWVRVQVWGCPSGDLGPWPEVRRRARLALASELVGVSRRIIDSAAVHVGSPRGPRREVLSEQAARSSLTHASAKMADVRALIAACWADGSVEAAERAVAVATAAQDAVAHQAMTICGEIDLRSCTRCGLSYQICSDPSTPSRPTIRASVTSHERGCAGLPASPDHCRARWSTGPAAGPRRGCCPTAARRCSPMPKP